MHLAKPSMKASGGPQITVTWKEVPDASIYTIYRSTQSTTGFKAIACVSDNRYVQKVIKSNQINDIIIVSSPRMKQVV